VIIVIAPKERKMCIRTGVGVQGKLTDGICKLIITNKVSPLFRKQDYNGCINAGVDGVIDVLKGEFTASAPVKNHGSPSNSGPSYFWFLIPLVIAVIFSFIGRWYGGIIGGIATGLVAYLLLSFWTIIPAGIIGLLVGLFAKDFLIAFAEAESGSDGGGSGYYGSSSSFSDSGSSSFGSGGDSGFSVSSDSGFTDGGGASGDL
jgi:uncharacterized protein